MLIVDYFRTKTLKHKVFHNTLDSLRDKVDDKGLGSLTLTELLQLNAMLHEQNAITLQAVKIVENAAKAKDAMRSAPTPAGEGQYL